MSTSGPYRHPLDAVPAGAIANSVTASPVMIDGRRALRVSLDEEVARHGIPGVDYVDQPTFLVLPASFEDGTIEVDVRSRLLDYAPDYARAFAGLAYRIAPDFGHFESLYVRPLNGRPTNPPSPRDRRAIQHFSYPDWPFDRLRELHPDEYEAGADIAPDQWIHLRLDIHGRHCVATIDGIPVLDVESLIDPCIGSVGLFVDIGSEAFFADLDVTALPR